MQPKKRNRATARQGRRTQVKRTLPPWLMTGSRYARKVAQVLLGPTGQQLAALALIGLGVVTLFTIAGMNSGKLVTRWAKVWVYLLGWGAYPFAALIVAVGLLWLRHLVHQPTAWRWRPFIGLELMLFGSLALTHLSLKAYGWSLVESGYGGGLVGWALYVFIDNYLGLWPTAVLLGGVAIFGVALACDVTREDVRQWGTRLGAAWLTLRSPAVESAAPSATRTAPPPIHTAAKPITRPKRTKRSRGKKSAPSATPIDRPADLPPLSLLRPGQMMGPSDREVEEAKRIIKKTLAQFHLPAEIPEVRRGPTVTQFGVAPGYIERGEDEPPRKVRISQIAALADDLALALSAQSLRIEAPVPGRSIVGIEVPNRKKATVTLRSVLETPAFAQCEAPLCFALGLDVAGSAIVADLAKMPHLLVAGTTGSGKSIFVKSLAASLVMNNSPATLRLLTIDPKIVELSHLNGLPHLLGPTETDLAQIIRALRWVAHEMDRRYKLFATAIARNLDRYNAKQQRRGEEPLPRIVVLIDELADLMLSAPDETERLLTRIAQMARATGIHLVVATQRPSTNVVTGLIKANFPARVSFATSSNVDSRVIIDTPGAESLLGQGDMLFLPPDASAPQRIQSCYISEEELIALREFWQKQAGTMPEKAPWAVGKHRGAEKLRLQGQPEDASLLDRAIAWAKQQGSISTSGLQRRLHISYPRAARLMEEMEAMGIVGPQESAGRKRQVIDRGEG